MKNEEKPNKPVSIHYDEQGNPDGIRVCALDEDFILALRSITQRRRNTAFQPERWSTCIPITSMRSRLR